MKTNTFLLIHLFTFKRQILEAEGMAVPEEGPCILQVVSEYLKEPCPITSLSGSQGPMHPEALKHPLGEEGEGKGRRETHQVSWFGMWLVLKMLEYEYHPHWSNHLSFGLQGETRHGDGVLPQPLPGGVLPPGSWRGRGDDDEERRWTWQT